MSDPIVNIFQEIFNVDNYYKLCRHDGISKDQKALLHKYKKLARDGNKVLIPYEFGKFWNKIKFGDLYAAKGVGLASFDRNIRAALAEKYYWDLDIVNAHPSILQNYCNKNKIPCPILTQFINQRKDIVAAICSEHKQERWWAKEECIKVFNGGYSCVHPILLQLIPEIEAIRNKVVEDNPEVFQIAFKINKSAAIASVTTLSLVFQNETRILLSHIIDFLKTKGRDLQVRIHDGGLVRKLDNETSFPITLIKETEQHILDICGYNIALEIKPLIHSFNFEDPEDLLNPDIIINDAYACERFVELVDIRKVNGEIFIFNPCTSQWGGERDIKLMIAKHSRDLIYKQKISDKNIRIFDYGGCSKNINAMLSLLPSYIEDGTLPIVFDYTLCSELKEKEVDDEILTTYQSLIDLMSNFDPVKSTYLINYLAHMIQKPYELPGVALTFSGEQGTGKSTLVELTKKWVLGDKLSYVYNGSQALFEKHDVGRLNKIMIINDEPKEKTCREFEDDLKAMITGVTQSFNPKNKSSIIAPNYNRIIFTTNYGCPIKIEENDRRIALFDVSIKKMGDIPFWKNLYKILNNAYAGKVIGEYLASVDISNYEPTKLFPSELKEMATENNTHPIIRFLKADHIDWTTWIRSSQLCDIYKKWCDKNNAGLYKDVNCVSFGRLLMKPVRDGLIIRKMRDGSSIYSKTSFTGEDS